MERKFSSDAVRRHLAELQADDLGKLTTWRKGKLLVFDVGARITSANQKWIEVSGDEDDGIDILLEFTNEDGNGTGKGPRAALVPRLPWAGLLRAFGPVRKTDGAEIFTIRKQRWVETWMNQPWPVMLVIGTFSEEDERAVGKEKVEFAEVRWMEITSVLRRESANGRKPVRQIEFAGERLDMSSVRKWRERVLKLR